MASAAQLRRLRKKYHLGEFARPKRARARPRPRKPFRSAPSNQKRGLMNAFKENFPLLAPYYLK